MLKPTVQAGNSGIEYLLGSTFRIIHNLLSANQGKSSL